MEFYEKIKDGSVTGPLLGITQILPGSHAFELGYRYAQVLNGRVVAVFTESEIVIKS